MNDLIKAMMDGYAVKLDDGTKMIYRPDEVTSDDPSPFRYLDNWQTSNAKSYGAWSSQWERLAKGGEILNQWYHRIPKQGTLCWVWDDDAECRSVATIVAISVDEKYFICVGGRYYCNAQPLTKSEALKMIGDAA